MSRCRCWLVSKRSLLVCKDRSLLMCKVSFRSGSCTSWSRASGAGGAAVGKNCVLAPRARAASSPRALAWSRRSVPTGMEPRRKLLGSVGGCVFALRPGGAGDFAGGGGGHPAFALSVACSMKFVDIAWPSPGKRASKACLWSTWMRPAKSTKWVTLPVVAATCRGPVGCESSSTRVVQLFGSLWSGFRRRFGRCPDNSMSMSL
mmetsp:Transcript_118889/g.341498  ORF Transcript_118889/g.341498 Transcript_118889/m.341498 type:complete len:204 (-) Transcript_118889:887-1498(-)